MGRKERPTTVQVAEKVLNNLYGRSSAGETVSLEEIATARGVIGDTSMQEKFRPLDAMVPRQTKPDRVTSREIDITRRALHEAASVFPDQSDLGPVRDLLDEEFKRVRTAEKKRGRRLVGIAALATAVPLAFVGVEAVKRVNAYNHEQQLEYEQTHMLGDKTTEPSSTGWRVQSVTEKMIFNSAGESEIIAPEESVTIVKGDKELDTNISFEEHQLTTGQDTTKVIVEGANETVQEVLLPPDTANIITILAADGTKHFVRVGRGHYDQGDDDVFVAEPVAPVTVSN